MRIEQYHHDYIDRETRDWLEDMTGTEELDDRLARLYCTYKAWRDTGESTGPLTRAEWAYFCQALGLAKFKLDKDSEYYAMTVSSGTTPDDHDPGFVNALIASRALYLALVPHNFDMSKWLEYQCALYGAVPVPPHAAKQLAVFKQRYEEVMRSQRARETAMETVRKAPEPPTNGHIPLDRDVTIRHYGTKRGRFTEQLEDGKYLFIENGTNKAFRIRKPQLEDE